LSTTHAGELFYQVRDNGAHDVFAGLSIADGKVYGVCRQRKRFVDFQTFVKQVITPESLQRSVKYNPVMF
jgi:hypothetical protein